MTKFCHDCEAELTPDNTSIYKGFDAGNYNIARLFTPMDKGIFTKCDDCFEADIDRYLEAQGAF
jgi:hypothetical protein